MKTGKTLKELLVEIERQQNTKKDYVAETSALEMVPQRGFDAEPTVALQMKQNGMLDVNNLAHRQVGEHVGIPAKYYDRMRTEAPELLCSNVNHWFNAQPAKRLVRVLDNRARAFLSNGYRPLENADLLEVAVPVVMDMGVEVISCEVTEQRLYLKAVDRRVIRQISGRHVVDGQMVEYDDVFPTLTLSNSEVGMGALAVETGFFKHRCKNMAIFRESSLRKYHVGARHELTAEVQALLTDRTRRITDAAIWSQVQDVVRGAFNADAFTLRMNAVQELAGQKIEGDPVKVVELSARRFNLTEGEQKSVLRNLIEGADLSRYGLMNAITRAAEDVADYDRSTEIERLGGAVIELKREDWRQLAEAA